MEFLRRTGSPVNRSLRTALDTGRALGVVDVVRMELLAGASIDCLVAAAALRTDAPVLARDRDFEVLASVSGLRLA